MKIAILTHHFPPRYLAGGEQYAFRLAQGLYQRGHHVEVVTIESITQGTLIPTCEIDEQYGFPVHRLFQNLAEAPNRLVWSFNNPQLGEWVKTYLQQTQPHLVHVNSGYLLGGAVPEASFALNLPTVLTLHDYWFLCPLLTLLRRNGQLCTEPVPESRCHWCNLSEKRRYRVPDRLVGGRLGDLFVALNRHPTLQPYLDGQKHQAILRERKDYLQKIMRQFDLVISPSRFLLDKMTAYGWQPQKMLHLPFGLDQTHLTDFVPPAKANALRIGYLGQMAQHKGVDLLLKAVGSLRGNYELVLYGKIGESTTYEKQLLKMGQTNPAVRFAGPYPNESVGAVLNSLDVLVIPSIWYENRPTVILEALATCTPVIATRLGGMAELIQHEKNGLLFTPNDHRNLAQQLQRLLSEPELLAQLREGIEPVKKVNEELDELEVVYQQLISA